MYPMPLGPTGISLVDVRDIAEAAAVALTGEGHHGKTYNVNGPDVLSGPGVAAIWSKVLARKSVTKATTWKLSRRKCANRHRPGRRSTFA